MAVVGYQVERNGTQWLATIHKSYNPCHEQCFIERDIVALGQDVERLAFDLQASWSSCKEDDFRDDFKRWDDAKDYFLN